MKKTDKYLLVLIMLLSLSSMVRAQKEGPLWNALLADISSDMYAITPQEGCLLDIENKVIGISKPYLSPDASAILFSSGRTFCPMKELSEIDTTMGHRLIEYLGDGTSIMDALMGCAKAKQDVAEPWRVLLLSNGNDNSSRVDRMTLSEVMRRENITVDAISLCFDTDSVEYHQHTGLSRVANKNNVDLIRDICALTGGIYHHVSTATEIKKTFADAVKMAQEAHGRQTMLVRNAISDDMYRWLLSNFYAEEIAVIDADTCSDITVLGHTFHGITDIKKAAKNGKCGNIYIGEDRQPYPCFDSFDDMNEDRFYYNFVFALSKSELDEKMRLLRTAGNTSNYKKLTKQTSIHLLPMIYYGDSGEKMQMSGCEFVEYSPIEE